MRRRAGIEKMLAKLSESERIQMVWTSGEDG